jgi:hypothetical protein
MSDLFITNTKDRPCISPPSITPPPLYKPIRNPLRKYISPGLIVGGLRYWPCEDIRFPIAGSMSEIVGDDE